MANPRFKTLRDIISIMGLVAIPLTFAIFWICVFLGLRDGELRDRQGDWFGVSWLVLALICFLLKLSIWWLVVPTLLADFVLISKVLGWVDLSGRPLS